MTTPMTDRGTVRSGLYANASKLSARQAIYRYLEGIDSPSVPDELSLRGDEVIVDVGCGNGNHLRELVDDGFAGIVVGVDLSPGMLAAVTVEVPLMVGDAAELPLPTGSADVALAMHMLYHCPDIPATVAELRRVLRPGGTLLASTNSLNNLVELRELWYRQLALTVGQPVGRNGGGAATRFNIEHGAEVLARSFESVELRRYDNTIALPDAAPGVAYLDSIRDFFAEPITDDQWQDALDAAAAELSTAIRRDGAFRVNCSRGVFVCR